jgi:hypothetical protein
MLTVLCCDSITPTTTENQYEPIKIELSVDHIPKYLETAVITCEYKVVVKPDWNSSGRWLIDGKFYAWGSELEIVSGDTTWIDTVSTHETRRHSVVVKAVRKGRVGLDGMVSAWAPDSIGGESESTHLWFFVD